MSGTVFKRNPSLGDPNALEACRMFRLQRWDQFEAIIAPLHPEQQLLNFAVLEDNPGHMRNAQLYWDGRPESPVANLLIAHSLAKRAIEARGAQRAHLTSDSQFEAYHRIFREAFPFIERAKELNPGSPIPHYLLIMGMEPFGYSPKDINGIFKQMELTYPQFRSGYEQLFLLLCKKWYGSHEKMFDFARRMASQPEKGALITMLIAQAHIERWLHYAEFDFDAQMKEHYFNVPEVRDEINAAFAKSNVTADAQESWQNATFYNAFAFCFCIMNDNIRAAQLLKRLGKNITLRPWIYHHPSPETAVMDYRRIVGLSLRP